MALYYRLLFPNQAFNKLEDIEQLVPFMYLSNVSLNRRRFGMEQSPISSSAVTTIKDENGNTSGVPFVIFNGLKSKLGEYDKTIEKNEILDNTNNKDIKNQNKDIILNNNNIKKKSISKNYQTINIIYPKQPDSLYWCLYIAHRGYSAYKEIGHRYGNIEIEEKHQITEMMRSNPNKIKEFPKRITKSQYQEIMSDFMTNKKFTYAMIAIFALYYNLHIWIVNLDKYEIPELWYIDICSNETINMKPIIIYHKNRNQYGINLLEGEQFDELIKTIKTNLFQFDNYEMPLKAISNYKIVDLENISDKLGITIEKKYKKQEIYDKILQKLSNNL